MKNIAFIRVDYRLIHGQVAVLWTKKSAAKKVVVVSDEYADDAFMKSVFKMALGQSTALDVLSSSQIMDYYNNDKEENINLMLVFRDIQTVYNSFKAGLPIKELNLGGVPKGENRIVIYNEVSVSKEEYEMLKEINEAGGKIYIQAIPTSPSVGFEAISSKFEK